MFRSISSSVRSTAWPHLDTSARPAVPVWVSLLGYGWPGDTLSTVRWFRNGSDCSNSTAPPDDFIRPVSTWRDRERPGGGTDDAGPRPGSGQGRRDRERRRAVIGDGG